MDRSVLVVGRAGPGSMGSSLHLGSPQLRGPGVLTILSQDKAATLPGVVARLVCHVDTENVVSHEVKHIHVACILRVRGVVGGPVEAAGGDLILQLAVRVLPSRTEQPVMAEGQWAQGQGRSPESWEGGT